MTGNRNNVLVAAAAVAALMTAAASASAQTADRRDRNPPPATLPGWVFTPYPVNNRVPSPPPANHFVVGGGTPRNSYLPSGPAPSCLPRYIPGGTTVIYQSSYPCYPNYPTYGAPGTNVIVNQNPVTYPAGTTVDGETRYESTPPIVTVVQTDGKGRTTMSSASVSSTSVFNNCAFPGYATAYLSGQTVVSPFGAYFGCPRYVHTRYVVLSTPYPYLSGRDTSSVISPYSPEDPYVTADASRGRALGVALEDLRRFWENGNAAGLRRRVQPDLSVGVFEGERFAYSLRRVDFLALAADALDRVQTISFRFTEVRERSDGLVSAYALQTYRSGDEGTVRTTRVRYTLVYLDGDWYLSAFSLVPGAP
ncbi:MAG: hypothetical protein H7Z41_04990 [Cytophagales bacterium]|nr:hypothetical protein [Armatimonadota bacterium]